MIISSRDRCVVLSSLMAGLLLLAAGCAPIHSPADAVASSQPDTPDASSATRAQSVAQRPTPRRVTPRRVEAIRASRYQLVTLSPQAGQHNLLKQTISMHLPDGMALTVADGLQHVLADSGLRLCQSAAQGDQFDTPLPAVDRHLGPTTLGDALRVLAGPAWRLRTNFATRRVCFDRRGKIAPRPEPSGHAGHSNALVEARHD